MSSGGYVLQRKDGKVARGVSLWTMVATVEADRSITTTSSKTVEGRNYDPRDHVTLASAVFVSPGRLGVYYEVTNQRHWQFV